MPSERATDQVVDAFSASKSLVKQATEEAARRGLTKSGFYRYCLAKELGYSEDDALELALHNTVQRMRQSVRYPENEQGTGVLNDAPARNPAVAEKVTNLMPDPNLSPKVKSAADKLESLARKRAWEKRQGKHKAKA
jgi:hypothetical protein